MLLKVLTLNSLPYIVGIVSSLLAANYVAPSSQTVTEVQPGTTAESTILSRQIVNRLMKSDRLPIKHADPQTHKKDSEKMPRQLSPSPKIKADCTRSIDFTGRCLVEVKLYYKIV